MISHEGGICSPDNDEEVVQNVTALVDCVKAVRCPADDDRLQMILMRDPRSIVMSTYNYLLQKNNNTLAPFLQLTNIS